MGCKVRTPMVVAYPRGGLPRWLAYVATLPMLLVHVGRASYVAFCDDVTLATCHILYRHISFDFL